jgi:hypothetical protein
MPPRAPRLQVPLPTPPDLNPPLERVGGVTGGGTTQGLETRPQHRGRSPALGFRLINDRLIRGTDACREGGLGKSAPSDRVGAG